MLAKQGARVGKSVIRAYQAVVNSETSGEKASKETMGKMKEKMGSMIKSPMTRSEATEILQLNDLEEGEEQSDPKHVMERFDTLFEKNLPEKGGSFYLQSKIYFAKEFLMQDYPLEENISKFNPDGQLRPDESEEAAKEEKAEEPSKENDEKKDDSKK